MYRRPIFSSKKSSKKKAGIVGAVLVGMSFALIAGAAGISWMEWNPQRPHIQPQYTSHPSFPSVPSGPYVPSHPVLIPQPFGVALQEMLSQLYVSGVAGLPGMSPGSVTGAGSTRDKRKKHGENGHGNEGGGDTGGVDNGGGNTGGGGTGGGNTGGDDTETGGGRAFPPYPDRSFTKPAVLLGTP